MRMKIHCSTRERGGAYFSVPDLSQGEKTRAGRNKRVVRLERGEVLGMGENKKGRDRRMRVDR